MLVYQGVNHDHVHNLPMAIAVVKQGIFWTIHRLWMIFPARNLHFVYFVRGVAGFWIFEHGCLGTPQGINNKPSPSHHHFYSCYVHHSQSWLVKMTLFYPHYLKKNNFLDIPVAYPQFFNWNFMDQHPISMAMQQEPVDWRYLLYIRPIFQAYFSGNIPTKYGQKYGTVIFNGNSRILKWRYVSTIFLAIFCGIPLHRPEK